VSEPCCVLHSNEGYKRLQSISQVLANNNTGIYISLHKFSVTV